MKTDNLRTSPDVYPLSGIRIIDGDTIEANIVLPFGQESRKRIRLRDWWAPELEGRFRSAGLDAKYALEIWLQDKDVWLLCPQQRTDKYGRVVGALWHLGAIVNPQMVIGHHQMTSEAHKAMSDEIREGHKQARQWPNDKA